MKTGIERIADERREQIEKHGWDLTRDADYKNGELVHAARFCLMPTNKELWPWHDNGIGTHFYKKILAKTDEQRIVIAGAFCAAELDRINGVSQDVLFMLFKVFTQHPSFDKMISYTDWNIFKKGEQSKWEAVYSYINTNNANYEPYQLLGYKPVVNIPRREAE